MKVEPYRFQNKVFLNSLHNYPLRAIRKPLYVYLIAGERKVLPASA